MIHRLAIVAAVGLFLAALLLSWMFHGTGVVRNDPKRNIHIPEELTMPLQVKAAVAVGVPVGGVIVWLIRLEGRVNTAVALQQALKEDIQYIRGRIDKALNGHGQ